MNVHPTQSAAINLPGTPGPTMDFLRFVELRSVLDLAELPDDAAAEQPWLLSLAIAGTEELDNTQIYFALLSMDSSILRLNGQDWERNYQVKTADEIRRIIQLWNEVPASVKSWTSSFLRQLNPNEAGSMDLIKRAQLGIAVYLFSYYPNIFKRWVLTVPYEIALQMKITDPLPIDIQSTVERWLNPPLLALLQNLEDKQSSNIPELELDDEEGTTKALNTLHNYGGFANA